MILIAADNIKQIREWCELNRTDTGSSQPYFIETEHEQGAIIPEDPLIERGIAELSIPFKWFIVHRGIEVIIEPHVY